VCFVPCARAASVGRLRRRQKTDRRSVQLSSPHCTSPGSVLAYGTRIVGGQWRLVSGEDAETPFLAPRSGRWSGSCVTVLAGVPRSRRKSMVLRRRQGRAGFRGGPSRNRVLEGHEKPRGRFAVYTRLHCKVYSNLSCFRILTLSPLVVVAVVAVVVGWHPKRPCTLSQPMTSAGRIRHPTSSSSYFA
jgi:hypothetical protein